MKGQINLQTLNLGEYQASLEDRLISWRKSNFNRRLWDKDPTLWLSEHVSKIVGLGWLIIPEIVHDQIDDIVSFAEEIKSEDVRHVVLLAMGGSSLSPEVYHLTFDSANGFPALIVLDSTHPAAIKKVEEEIDIPNTIFLVSSKSGTTIETISLFRYFWQKVGQTVGNPSRHFVAITDPGTPLAKLSEERRFRRRFLAPPDVGGRYSALTVFGLVPAGLIGVKLHQLLDRARIASDSCAFSVPEQKISGLVLGAALGELTKAGRDKVTFLTSSSIKSFPAWLEQLIAESTGKDGKGMVPIVEEPLAPPETYGKDRFFIYLSVEDDKNPELERMLTELEDVGHPTVSIRLSDKPNMGQEIFRWELAVAAAGSVLGVHPFNQPDVELAKQLARETVKKGKMQESENVKSFVLEEPEKLAKALERWLARARGGDYVAIHAYLPMQEKTTSALQVIRQKLLNRLNLATTLGYGPRFLHSTGQLHKGGPNTGIFLQIVDEPDEDIPVPETNYTFGTLIKAQAIGDYKALEQRGRRLLRVNLKKDVKGGLERLAELIT